MKMTIKELLGIPERTLLSFIKSAYKLGINPLPALRKRFNNIDFKFTCNVFQKYMTFISVLVTGSLSERGTLGMAA